MRFVVLSNLRKSEEAANQPALTDVTAGEAQKGKVDEYVLH